MCAQSLSSVQFFVNPWTVACPVPLPMGFSKLEYWIWLPFPTPGDFHDSRIEPVSPALVGGFLTTTPPGCARPLSRVWLCGHADHSPPNSSAKEAEVAIYL